jgi:hypothetical protein
MKLENPISKVLIFTAVAGFATSFGVALDGCLLQRGVSGFAILCASNALIGIVTGVLVLQHKERQKEKHQILEERIETIAEVNQHIRSVLTSVAFYGRQNGSANAEVMTELLRRVEANLAHLFKRLLLDESLPQSVVKAAKNTAYSIAQ